MDRRRPRSERPADTKLTPAQVQHAHETQAMPRDLRIHILPLESHHAVSLCSWVDGQLACLCACADVQRSPVWGSHCGAATATSADGTRRAHTTHARETSAIRTIGCEGACNARGTGVSRHPMADSVGACECRVREICAAVEIHCDCAVEETMRRDRQHSTASSIVSI